MKIIGNLLCDPNYDYIHLDGDWSSEALSEPWVMFAVMDHAGGNSQKIRVKARGDAAVRIKRIDPRKGDFVKITGKPVMPEYGNVFVLADTLVILKKRTEGKR